MWIALLPSIAVRLARLERQGFPGNIHWSSPALWVYHPPGILTNSGFWVHPPPQSVSLSSWEPHPLGTLTPHLSGTLVPHQWRVCFFSFLGDNRFTSYLGCKSIMRISMLYFSSIFGPLLDFLLMWPHHLNFHLRRISYSAFYRQHFPDLSTFHVADFSVRRYHRRGTPGHGATSASGRKPSSGSLLQSIKKQ